MGLAALIALAVFTEYVSDVGKGSFTPKPLIGGGIALVLLSAMADFDKRIAYVMAWLILLAVIFAHGNELGDYLAKVGGQNASTITTQLPGATVKPLPGGITLSPTGGR